MKKKFKIICCLLLAATVTLFSLIAYTDSNLNDAYTVADINNPTVSAAFPVTCTVKENALAQADAGKTVKENRTAQIKLFGVFPVKDVNLRCEKAHTVSLLGTPFGIKLYMHGVLVIKTSAFKSDGISCCPVEKSGIKAGDYILSVNGINVYTNAQMESIVNQSEKDILIEYSRNNKTKKVTVKSAVSDSDGKRHIGVWIRDSAAGIGTLTFYDKSSNVIAGLGHGLNDIDTESLVSVANGCILPAKIISVTKAEKGKTGALNGTFNGAIYSKALQNSDMGIFAKFDKKIKTYQDIEVAPIGETKTGKAEILTTISGTQPKYYSCEVVKITSVKTGSKNFLIKITDKKLLEKTGGIVQGMSGSPIIQNGKFIGAVTHVFVDNPEKGYAIFAENMLKKAQGLVENQTKKAS